jgi:magnesium transporter
MLKSSKLRKLKDFRVGSAIIAFDLQEEELKLLSSKFSLDYGLLNDALDPYEAPRMEIKKGLIYIFARFPKQKKSTDQIFTNPILLVMGQDFLLSVSQEEPLFIKNLLKKNECFTTQRTKLLLEIINQTEYLYNNLLTTIHKKINYFSFNIEKLKDKDVYSFLNFEILLNEFLNALIPFRHILETMRQGKIIELYEDDKELIDDIKLLNEQLIERAKSGLSNLVNIRKSYEVITTNKLNKTMKILTTITVVLTLPTMISSFYGMNVHLPYADKPWIFGVLMGIMILSIIIFLIIFRRNK